MEHKRKIMLLCPVRNEEASLKRLLPAWQLFADYIIIADQHSEDNTRQVLSRFDKVIIVDNPDTDYNEINRNSLLIAKAREIDSQGIFIYLDADELLSANILSSPEWKTFCQEEPGTVGYLPWAWLWRSPYEYFKMDSHFFTFIDDGRKFKPDKIMHGHRGLGFGDSTKDFIFHEVVNIHFRCLNYELVVRKNNWYKIWHVLNGSKSFFEASMMNNWFYHVQKKDLFPTPREWLQGYMDKGIDVTSIEKLPLYWYEVEILRWFNQYGTRKFFLLDIWRGVDWEEKRRIALEKGISGIPADSIKRPGRPILLFSGICTYKFSLPDLLRKIKYILFKIILPQSRLYIRNLNKR